MKPDNYRKRFGRQPEILYNCQTCGRKFNPKKEKSRNPSLCKRCTKLQKKMERNRA